tara:strand:+ start:2213 stop:3634 length:1422 start_codon:yes stop_codon:yes gene_type:complete
MEESRRINMDSDTKDQDNDNDNDKDDRSSNESSIEFLEGSNTYNNIHCKLTDIPRLNHSIWEENSETDDSEDGVNDNKSINDEFDFLDTIASDGVQVYTTNSFTGKHKKPYKKLTYEDVKKKISLHYDQSIINRYSSAVDVLTTYVKYYSFLFHEASEYCKFRLNLLMFPCIMVSSICSVLAGFCEDEYPYVFLSVAFLNAFVSIMLALVNYLKLDACSEAHTISVFQYNKVKGYLEFTSYEILLFQNPLLSSNGVMNAMNEWKKTHRMLKINNEKLYQEKKNEKFNEYINEKREIEKKLIESVQNNVNEVKKMLKNIKENNRFIIPKRIINDYNIIYNVNIFTFLKNIDNYRMTILTKLKNVRNEIRYIINKKMKNNASKEELFRIKELYKRKNSIINELVALNGGHSMLDTMFGQVITNAQLKRKYWYKLFFRDIFCLSYDISQILPEPYKDPYDCGFVCYDGEYLMKKLI